MRMRRIEKWAMRSPARAWVQRRWEVPRMLRGLALAPGARCLEIGCGHGAGALLLGAATRCRLLVGVDIDGEMLRAARRLLAHPPRWARAAPVEAIRLVGGDALRLPFADGAFDAAFLFGVLHHIRRWPAAVAEVFRVLAPGGVFALEEGFFGGSLLTGSALWRHVAFGEADLRAALAGAGFVIERLERTRILPMTFVRARRPGSAAPSPAP